jgi:hypothetical protein
MILYITIAIATVLIAGLIQSLPASVNEPPQQFNAVTRQQMLNKAALLFIFVILFIAQAIRLNVGADYIKYVGHMHEANLGAPFVPTEAGFNGVVRIIYGLSGFDNYLLVFAIFAFAIIAIFLWTIYRDSENFWFSFFLFMAFAFYFQSFSTVRYYLAVAVALCSIPFILRKQWFPFIFFILLGSTFHRSLLVVIPLYFLATLKWKKWALIIFGLFCTTFFFLQDFYLWLMLKFYPEYHDTEYLAGGTSYLNIIRCTGILIFSLIYYRQAIKDHVRNRFYFYCNAGALVLYVCCSFIPLISRIGIYLTATHIFFLPALIKRIEDKRQRYFFTTAIIVAGVIYFIIYMMGADDDGVRLLPYQTFLFHEINE